MFFNDYITTKEILKNCYRKFKSSVYYANNLQYLRLKIAIFEDDPNKMDSIFSDMTEMLIENRRERWEDLLKEVSYRVLPKVSGAKTQNNDEHILSNYIEKSNEIVIEKVNFFIDAPLEVFIIDTLWTLLIGKLIAEKNIFGAEVQANILEDKIFNNSEKDILKAIDFCNLKLFKPYFKGYKNWKNNAVFKIEKLYDAEKDSTLVSLDLSSYFYTVDFDFDLFDSLLTDENDKRYRNFRRLTEFIVSLYNIYSNLLYKHRKDVHEGQTIIPIGLLSSGILANLYLHEFDVSIKKNKQVAYYSRYVDDIIIIIPNANKDDSLHSVIDKYLLGSFNFTKNGDLSINGCPNISIQKGKVKILKTFAAQSKTYINVLKKEISNTSEPHLLPEIDLDFKSFFNKVYTQPSDTIKIRELNTMEVNKLSLMKLIHAYLASKKNTSERNNKLRRKKHLSYYEKYDRETQDQLKLFFAGGNLFQLYAKWDRIFNFALLYNNNFILAESIYQDISKNIENVNYKYDFIRSNKQKLINNRLKKDLKETLEISLSMALSIRYEEKLFRETFKSKNRLLHMATIIQKSNMFDNNLVEFPMINYYIINDKTNKITYSGIPYSEFRKRYSSAEINEFAVKFSPRFIHFQEYCLSQNILKIEDINKELFLPELITRY